MLKNNIISKYIFSSTYISSIVKKVSNEMSMTNLESNKFFASS